MTANGVALLTQDDELRDQLLALTTASAVPVQAFVHAPDLLAVWARVAMVVVGIDQAPVLARLGPARRHEVFLVGGGDDAEQLVAWSGVLGAAVVVLPGGASRVTAALAGVGHPAGRGRLVSVLGGSGGVGASTCAAALAGAFGRRGVGCALLDLDPVGGGLDLLLGAELDPGWRWPRLSGVRGHLGDLSAELVRAEGFDLLSMARGRSTEAGVEQAGVEQVSAVLQATARSHAWTVVDHARTVGPAGAEVIRRSDWLVLVVRPDVRGLAAALEVLGPLPSARRTGLLVRGRGLPTATLASRLSGAGSDEGAVVELGRIEDDPAVRLDAERGVLPGRSARSRLGRAAAAVVEQLELDETAPRLVAAART